MKSWRATLRKGFSLLMVAITLLGLMPTMANAAVEANIDLEMSVKQGYTDGAATLDTVQSGEPFYVYMRYAMNASSTDDKYLAPTLRVELPEGVTVDPDHIRANTHIATDANGKPAVGVETYGGKTYVYFHFVNELTAGSAATLSFQAKFDNMTTVPTPENTAGPVFKAVVEGSIIPRGGGPEGFVPASAEASVKVDASGNWGLFKSINDTDTGLSTDKLWYNVGYDINVSLLNNGVDPAVAAADPTGDYYRYPDAFGRLEFDKFVLTDLLPVVGPSAVIQGEGAQLVEIGMYNNDGTRRPLVLDTDYTLDLDADGDITAVHFADNVYEKFADGHVYDAVKAGDSNNSRFYINLKYPATAYASRIDEALKTYTLLNNATLTYSLVGDDADVVVTDSASSSFSLRESITDTHSFSVKKMLKIDNRSFVLNGAAIGNGYAGAKFTLWLDAACTKPARMYDAENNSVADVPELVIDADNTTGTVTFEKLRQGDYYLREEYYAGFSLTSPVGMGGANNPIRVTVCADGSIEYYDGSTKLTAADDTIVLTNSAGNDGPGILEFVKKGKDAKGVTKTLSNVQFDLYATDVNGEATGTPITRVSGMEGVAGYVRFDALKAGNYILRETLPNNSEYLPMADIKVTITANKITSVTVGDEPGVILNQSGDGHFTLKKTTMAGIALTGAKVNIYFDTNKSGVYDAGDALVAADVSIGTYESGPVAAGKYFVVETTAPNNYKKSDDVLAFTVAAMSKITVELKNEKLGWLSVFKYGRWTGDGGPGESAVVGLSGAVFAVYPDNNGAPGETSLGTLTTKLDATGQPSYDGTASLQLASGVYWLVETTAPVGYALDPTPHKVIVVAGDTATGTTDQTDVTIHDGHTVLSIDNVSDKDFGRIVITKTNALNGNLLPGVTFKIYRDAGETDLVTTMTTDSNGVAVSAPLAAGNYFIREVLPANLVNSYTPIGLIRGFQVVGGENIAITTGDGVTVTKNVSLSLLVKNEPLVSYSFIKTDSATNAGLSGAKFSLFDQEPVAGVTAIKTNITSDSNGKVTFTGLKPGATYWYKETTAPGGYVLNTAAKSFVAPSAPSYTQAEPLPNIKNDKFIELTIYKYGNFDGADQALTGAKFVLYPSALSAAPAAGDAAAQFAIDKAAASANNTVVTPSKETDANGKLVVTGLAPGGWWVVETVAPAGYALDETPRFVKIEAGGVQSGGTPTYKMQVDIPNTSNTGSLEIEKVNKVSRAPMTDVTFELYTATESGGLGTLVKRVSTGTNGRASWSLLPAGKYILVETVPAGFADVNETVVEIKTGETTRLVGSKAIENQPLGKIQIKKTAVWQGVNGNPNIVQNLGGAIFEVRDASDNLVATLTTDKDGNATTGWLPDGVYTIKETKAPDGFIADPDSKTATIKVEANKSTTFSPEEAFVNTHTGGKLRIFKSDTSGRALGNVKFNVWQEVDSTHPDAQLKTVDVGGQPKDYYLRLIETITTDSKGYAVSSSLPLGDYFIEELAAPTGYSYIYRWSGEFAVIAGRIYDTTVVNYPVSNGSGMKFSVGSTSTGIAGAYIALFESQADAVAAAARTFTATELDGLLGNIYDGVATTNAFNIAQVVKSKADGTYTFTALNTYKTYYLVELIAPVGHVRSVKVHTIAPKVADDGTRSFDLPHLDNLKFGSIEIYKTYYMTDTARPLEGAEFALFHAVPKDGKTDAEIARELDKAWVESTSNLLMGGRATNGVGELMDSATTNSSGGIRFSNLAPGYYFIKEIKAPEGFATSNEFYVVQVLPGGNSNFFKAGNGISNTADTHGEFKLDKRLGDANGNATDTRLAATFEIEQKVGGAWVRFELPAGYKDDQKNQFTTTPGGAYVSAPIPAGEYRVREVSAPSADYTLRGEWINFTVAVGKTTIVEDAPSSGVVRNFKKGSLEIKKFGVFDDTEFAALGGVTFRLYADTNGNKTYDEGVDLLVSEQVTSAAGTASWTKLDAGTYFLREISVGSNTAYGISMSTLMVTVKPGEKVQYISQDSKNPLNNIAIWGKIAIEKVDASSKTTKLANAEFEIYNNAACTGTVYDTLKTDSNGRDVSVLLPAGQYWLKETVAPDNYEAVTSVIGPVTVLANKTNTDLTGGGAIENTKKQSVDVIKVSSTDTTNKALLDGEFIFELRRVNADGSDGAVVATASTKVNGVYTGVATFRNLLPNTQYRVYETAAPENYIRRTDGVTFTTNTDGTVQKVYFANEPKGKVEILKITIWGDQEIIRLKGATFQMYKALDNTPVGDPFVSDENGVALSGWLEAGEYYFIETASPNGDAFAIEHENGQPKHYPVTVTKGETNTVYTSIAPNNITAIKNEAKWGRFLLQKLATGTTTGLSGATFELYKYNGFGDKNAINSYSKYGTANEYQLDSFTVSGADVGGVFVEGAYMSGYLPTGYYAVVETAAPTGYALDSNPHFFEINIKTTTELTVKNDAKGALKVLKTSSEDNAPISGVSFQLYKGEVNGQTTLEMLGAPVATQSTDDKGEALFLALDPGVYTLRENSRPNGFALNSTLYTVTIPKSGTVVLTEQPVENDPDKGIGYIFKYATRGNTQTGLEGAKFEIYSNATLTEKVAGVGVLTTGANGYAVTPMLTPGTYWVKEIQAPNGYTLDDRLAPTVQTLVIKPVHHPNLTDPVTRVNYVAFENFASQQPAGMPVSLTKTASPSVLPQSLLLANGKVVFTLDNFTTGGNALPMENFTLTDTAIVFKDASGNVIPTQNGDYSFLSVNIGRAYNRDAETAAVSARVSYQLNGQVDNAGNPVWSANVTMVDDVQNIGAGGYTVTLPLYTATDFVTGVRIEYFGTGKNFLAEPVTLEAEMTKRASGTTVKEAATIENTAQLRYDYDVQDNTGNKVNVTKDASANASIKVPAVTDQMPIVKLTNTVDGGVGRANQLGHTLSFTVTAQNTSVNPFRHPVIVIEVPAHTTLDMSSIKVIGPDGLPLASHNNASSPFEIESTIVNGKMTQHLVFNVPDVTLGKDEKITITYDTVIDATTPKSVTLLTSPAYLTSHYQLPAAEANPHGTSFTNHSSNNVPVVNISASSSVKPMTGADDTRNYEHLIAHASASVVHADHISIVKEQKNGRDSVYKGAGQFVYVHPDGTVDYRLTVINGLSEKVKNLRIIDLLPEKDDGYIKRNSSTGTVFTRDTEIEERPRLTGPVTVQAAVGETVTVYYSVADWSVDARTANYPGAQGVIDELPMLYKNDGTTTGTWAAGNWMTEAELTAANKTWSDVTGVGVEVAFVDGMLMDSSDAYTLRYTMTYDIKTPGFTLDQIDEYYDKKIANSAVTSVLTEKSTSPWIVENLQVISYMRLPAGSIGDYAFYDNDNNGIQSAGDEAIAGLGVRLVRTDLYPDGSSNTAYYNTVTDANGLYLFDNLPCNYLKETAPAGSTSPSDYVGEVYTSYEVIFDRPVKKDAAGNVLLTYAPTLQDQGNDDAFDSDIDSTGRVKNVTLNVVEDETGTLVGRDNMTIDAGFVAPCSLGDYVWLDTDRDGIQGESGTGIPDAIVRLYRVEGADRILTATTQTDASGYYLFNDLVPGSYVVEFDISSLVKTGGYTYKYAFTKTIANPDAVQSQVDSDARHTMDADDRIRRTDIITLHAGDAYRDCDAGLTVYSALGGFIFDDRNYNDMQDLMYPLPGTVVTLYGSIDGAIDESVVLGQVTVDGTGRFLFDNLVEGTYYLKYDFPDGYSAVNARAALVNGVNDITLDSNCENNLSSNLNVGYSLPIVLESDSVDTTWDAGARMYSAIGDYVWYDTNRDGIQDANEVGAAGVDVVLQSRSLSSGSTGAGQWNFEGQTVTDADGYYLFTGLRGGVDANIEYRVIFLPDKKYEITTLNVGDPASDSDALSLFIDGLGYPTDAIWIDYGQTDLTWDAGLIEVKSALGDFVWYDANRNGLQDDGEAVLKGVLCILERNGTGDLENPNAWVEVSRMYTTDEGRYFFDNLSEGYYRVVIGIPNIYSVTRLERGSASNVDSDAIYRTASAVASAKGITTLLRYSVISLVVTDPDVTAFGTRVIDHTNAANTVGVTFFKTRTVYLGKNTVDLTWDVGVYTVQTGDAGGATMWFGIASMSLAAIFLLWYLLNRRRLRGEE